MPHMWSAICREDATAFTRFIDSTKSAKGPVVLIVFDAECGECLCVGRTIVLSNFGKWAQVIAKNFTIAF